jgi:hypothetical protein
MDWATFRVIFFAKSSGQPVRTFRDFVGSAHFQVKLDCR